MKPTSDTPRERIVVSWQLVAFFVACIVLDALMLWSVLAAVQQAQASPYIRSSFAYAQGVLFLCTPLGLMAVIAGLGGLNALKMTAAAMRSVHKWVYVVTVALGILGFLSNPLSLYLLPLLNIR